MAGAGGGAGKKPRHYLKLTLLLSHTVHKEFNTGAVREAGVAGNCRVPNGSTPSLPLVFLEFWPIPPGFPVIPKPENSRCKQRRRGLGLRVWE